MKSDPSKTSTALLLAGDTFIRSRKAYLSNLPREEAAVILYNWFIKLQKKAHDAMRASQYVDCSITDALVRIADYRKNINSYGDLICIHPKELRDEIETYHISLQCRRSDSGEASEGEASYW